VTGADQSVSASLTYEAFGQTVASSGSSSNPYRFAGAWGYRSDGDAGLMLVGARYYDAQVGRFISRDTYLDQHPYLYCNHDPVNAVDPSGHWSVTYSEVSGSVGGVVGGISVVSTIGSIIESHTPPHTFWHGIGGTLAGGGISMVGIGMVAAGAIIPGTFILAPVVIPSVVIAGTFIAVEGICHSIEAWF